MVDFPQEFLCSVGQIVIFCKPAAIDAVETVASVNCPIAPSFARLGGKQNL